MGSGQWETWGKNLVPKVTLGTHRRQVVLGPLSFSITSEGGPSQWCVPKQELGNKSWLGQVENLPHGLLDLGGDVGVIAFALDGRLDDLVRRGGRRRARWIDTLQFR